MPFLLFFLLIYNCFPKLVVESDNLVLKATEKQAVLSGNVKADKDGTSIMAPDMIVSFLSRYEVKDISAFGGVNIHNSNYDIVCESVECKGNKIFLLGEHILIKSQDLLYRVDPGSITAHDGVTEISGNSLINLCGAKIKTSSNVTLKRVDGTMIAIFSGKTFIVYNGVAMSASSAEYNSDSKVFSMIGDVLIMDGGNVLSGSLLKIDLVHKKYSLESDVRGTLHA